MNCGTKFSTPPFLPGASPLPSHFVMESLCDVLHCLTKCYRKELETLVDFGMAGMAHCPGWHFVEGSMSVKDVIRFFYTSYHCSWFILMLIKPELAVLQWTQTVPDFMYQTAQTFIFFQNPFLFVSNIQVQIFVGCKSRNILKEHQKVEIF